MQEENQFFPIFPFFFIARTKETIIWFWSEINESHSPNKRMCVCLLCNGRVHTLWQLVQVVWTLPSLRADRFWLQAPYFTNSRRDCGALTLRVQQGFTANSQECRQHNQKTCSANLVHDGDLGLAVKWQTCDPCGTGWRLMKNVRHIYCTVLNIRWC